LARFKAIEASLPASSPWRSTYGLITQRMTAYRAANP
jgi:hypothetical protein